MGYNFGIKAMQNESIDPRFYYGELTPGEVGAKLIASFHRGNYRAHLLEGRDQVIVQIVTDRFARSGGQTAATITIRKTVDGIAVQVGKQAWMGVAASLGQTALSALHNPLSLLNRLDDIAQDIESLQLSEKIWQVIDELARASGATQQLSERLRRLECNYCGTANPVGEPSCIACGAPLGNVQPRTCQNCGFVVRTNELNCPNCRKVLPLYR